MAKPVHIVSRLIAWVLAIVVGAVGIGLVWVSIIVPFQQGVQPLVVESVFAVGTLSTGLAFVLLSLDPTPAAAWLVGLVGMSTICLEGAMRLYSRVATGHAITSSEMLRIVAGALLLCAVAWLWLKSVRRGP